MDAEIRSLEEKVNQFVALCQRLRADNHELRQQLASAQSENKHLSDKVVDAKARIETLLSQIPEEET